MTDLAISTQGSTAARVRRWIQLFAVRGLIVVGALWVGGHSLMWLVEATRTFWQSGKPAMEIPSPDGRYKAVVFVSMGGGPGTSYCGTSVYVVSSRVSAAAIGGDRDRVYSGSCGGLREGHWKQSIRWKSARELDIVFDPTSATSGSTGEATIRGYAGGVRIDYLFERGGGSW